VNHTKERNIVYVCGLGDITNNNNPTQWDIANKSYRMLDNVVPYALVTGNHDTGNVADTRNTTNFNKYFPMAQYMSWPTFGGVYETNQLENSYHIFTAGGCKWLIIALEFAPRDDVLRWANRVVEAHPDCMTLVVTHAYLTTAGARIVGVPYGVNNDPAGASDGVEIWNNFLKRHRNIFNLYCGHMHSSSMLVSNGENGNTVYQMLSDYQSYANGGSGYLRILDRKDLFSVLR
jgi:hypothetical protein